jgi:hypothetical protein
MMDANQQRFDYIDLLMNQARKGRVIERTQRIKFEKPDAPDLTLWRAKAIVDLYEWMKSSKDYSQTADLWSAVYIQCGACLRGWQDWCADNPIGDDLPGWIESATRIVTEKRWI